MNTGIEILESYVYNYCTSGNSSQVCGSSIWWQRGKQALLTIIRAHMYSFCLTMLGILLDISGHAHQVKEMTTSSTVILLTKRYPNPNDCKSGTRRCWTSLCQSALSTITRFVKCMFVLWEGFDQSHLRFFFLCLMHCLILGVYYISFKGIEH